MDVLILITGGTLDKVHDTLSESLIFEGGQQIGSVLARGRTQFPRLETLMQVDSLDMTDTHRAEIIAAVRAAPEDRIVITHGTGTMALTAQALATAHIGKTVVLTGAMRPHSLGQSDASFNVGGAVIAAQTLPPGIYGVMNGRVIPAANLHKNTQTGRFAD